MVERAVGQEVAGGEAGVTGADDDGGEALDGVDRSVDFDGDLGWVGERIEHG